MGSALQQRFRLNRDTVLLRMSTNDVFWDFLPEITSFFYAGARRGAAFPYRHSHSGGSRVHGRTVGRIDKFGYQNLGSKRCRNNLSI